jgi:hypothetical protein
LLVLAEITLLVYNYLETMLERSAQRTLGPWVGVEGQDMGLVSESARLIRAVNADGSSGVILHDDILNPYRLSLNLTTSRKLDVNCYSATKYKASTGNISRSSTPKLRIY